MIRIDVVIPWCGYEHSEGTSQRDRNNNELLYCLRSIEKYAGWVNHIYILVNDITNDYPKWIKKCQDWISVIDRTQLFRLQLK